MVRTASAEHTFENTWETTTAAFWVKYPNPFASHVLSVDVLERRIDPETGNLHTTRLLNKTNRKPGWMNWWLPDTSVWILETSVVDRAARTLQVKTENCSLRSFLVISEDGTFSPLDKSTTQFQSTASAFSPLPIGRLVEAFSEKRYIKNANKAAQGLEWRLAKDDFAAYVKQDEHVQQQQPQLSSSPTESTGLGGVQGSKFMDVSVLRQAAQHIEELWDTLVRQLKI